MIYSSFYSHVRAMAVVALVVWLIVTPRGNVIAASYTWGGQEFSTYEDMQEYAREYARIQHELYGTTNNSFATFPTIRTTAQAKTSRTVSPTSLRAQVSVRTRSADAITPKSARLTGTIDRTTARAVEVWFEYGTDSSDLWFGTAHETLGRDFGSAVFDRNVTNLVHNTTYYYRAVGKNERGERVYGSLKSFTTLVDPYNTDSGIRVNGVSVEEVKDNRATLTGSVSFPKATSGYVWFEYGDEQNDLYKKTPVVYVSKQARNNKLTYTVRNLKEQTTYYVRMVGYDASGIKNFSSPRSFTTPKDVVGEKPTVVTERATDVSEYSATLQGRVGMNDYANGKAFFVYGEDRTALQNIPQRYSRYSRIKTNGDALQKVLVDNDVDREEKYTTTIANLDFKITIYYAFGVEYQDDDGNDHLVLGYISSFTTKDVR